MVNIKADILKSNIHFQRNTLGPGKWLSGQKPKAPNLSSPPSWSYSSARWSLGAANSVPRSSKKEPCIEKEKERTSSKNRSSDLHIHGMHAGARGGQRALALLALGFEALVSYLVWVLEIEGQVLLTAEPSLQCFVFMFSNGILF